MTGAYADETDLDTMLPVCHQARARRSDAPDHAAIRSVGQPDERG